MVDAPVLVLAATGGQGRAVTDALLGRGARIRVMVRDPERAAARELAGRGVEVVAGSLSDEDSLVAAMRGVASVFAFTTPFEAGLEAEVGQGRAILSSATRARIGHLVFSSVAGADQDSGVPHFESKARIEADLASGDVPYTVLGPTYFFDNALGGQERILHGSLDLPLPSDRPLQQLARTDLGAFAAEVMLNPAPYVGQRIELASDAPTPEHMAASLSKALGREVHHVRTPLAAVGNPDMHAMWAFLNGPGYRVDIPALHDAHPEIPWTSFEYWATHTWADAS
ncbi:NmrA/HSCARG family protein [Streptomyces sp. NPDC053741]|uniref:NmrA/HSCARG family protein n=1 Tax=Streptomyces TaxID=1883 RepID=UPI0004C72B1E|nr:MULTISPECIES: NmrA/HSCARG family protein [Streptomyces]MCY1649619.1 NmrA/HSCARG family protein [Streptomyces sp. SL203]WSZ46043.1 NmrA/HSCARG family protein [[Kitasatospora] papulosa]